MNDPDSCPFVTHPVLGPSLAVGLLITMHAFEIPTPVVAYSDPTSGWRQGTVKHDAHVPGSMSRGVILTRQRNGKQGVKYRAQITGIDGCNLYLGMWGTEKAAAQAYDRAAICIRCNPPPPHTHTSYVFLRLI